MSEKVLTEQDLKVLNKVADEASGKMSMGERLNFLGWEDYAGRIFSINHKKEIERAVILSRQETEKKQVPVRLKSESVDLKWLEDKVKKGLTKRPKKIIEYHKIKAKDKKTFLTLGYRTALNDLLSAVRAKAKEVKK